MLEISYIAGYVIIASGFIFFILYQNKNRIQPLEKKLHDVEENHNALVSDKVTAETKFKVAIEQLKLQEEKLKKLQQEKESAVDARHEANKQAELARQRVEEIKHQMVDWEKTKDESLKIAKEAMFETGGDLFKKKAEESAQKVNEQFMGVIKSVSQLNHRLSKNEATVDTVWQSLSSPNAIGNFSEIGLENTLKNYGLIPNRDFVMQYAINDDGKSLRPDAVVFLPDNDLLIIDSKASKFFLELGSATNEAEEKQASEMLKKSMNEHIKILASKGYKEATKQYLKHAEKDKKIGHILTLMFVHSDACIEKMVNIDPQLHDKATKEDIVISGPAGLSAILSSTRYAITKAQQIENQEEIQHELTNLLGSVEVILGHALKVGKGIESAAKNFQKFGASVNRSLLPKAHRLNKLGVTLPKNKKLPAQLPSYHVSSESSPLIEGEGVEEQQAELLEEKAE